MEEPMFNQFTFFTRLFKDWARAKRAFIEKKKLFYNLKCSVCSSHKSNTPLSNKHASKTTLITHRTLSLVNRIQIEVSPTRSQRKLLHTAAFRQRVHRSLRHRKRIRVAVHLANRVLHAHRTQNSVHQITALDSVSATRYASQHTLSLTRQDLHTRLVELALDRREQRAVLVQLDKHAMVDRRHVRLLRRVGRLLTARVANRNAARFSTVAGQDGGQTTRHVRLLLRVRSASENNLVDVTHTQHEASVEGFLQIT